MAPRGNSEPTLLKTTQSQKLPTSTLPWTEPEVYHVVPGADLVLGHGKQVSVVKSELTRKLGQNTESGQE